MKMLLAALTTILALAFALPINAAPVYVPKTEQARVGGLELVHKRKDWQRNYWRGNGQARQPFLEQASSLAVVPLQWELLSWAVLWLSRLLSPILPAPWCQHLPRVLAGSCNSVTQEKLNGAAVVGDR